MTHSFAPARRHFLHHTARLAAAASLPALVVSCAGSPKLENVAAPAPLNTVAGTPALPAAAPAPVAAAPATPAPQTARVLVKPRALAMVHTHTHEKIDLVYASGERYVPEALGGLNRFLRDHYSGEVGVMDPQMFDILHRVQQALGCKGSFEVISGYRCPSTNDKLRNKGGGGVAVKSLHMQGRAIDVRLPGVPLAELHEAALSLRAGGVGFYPQDQFVHLDTGRVRNW